MVSLHFDALDGGAGIVRRAEHDLHALILPDNRTGLLQFAKQMLRQAQRLDDGRVVFAGLSVDHAACGSVGVLVGLDAAELVHEVFGDEQEVSHAVQPPGLFVAIELIERVERLELDARVPVEPREADFAVYLRDNRFGAAVTVGVAGHDLRIAAQQHIVHAPCVDGEALDALKPRLGFLDSRFDVEQQGFDIPGQMSVPLRHAVGETVDLLGFEFAVLHPADDVPPAGRANVDGKIVVHVVSSCFR